MGNIFNLIKKLFGRNSSLTNDVPSTQEIFISETIDETPIPMSINWERLVNCILEEGNALDHFDVHDLRIVAGNKTLTVIYDRRELGLHSFGIYDYCSTSDEEGHKLMAQIIRENEDEAYKSLLIESSEDELWLNIADCTNRGAGAYHELYEQMIEVFEPIILKFIKDNAVLDNVGFCVADFGDYGTSHVAPFLCQKLNALGLNVHVAIIESNLDIRLKNKLLAASKQLEALSCTYKVFQYPNIDCNFDLNRLKEDSQYIISKAVGHLRTVISE
ncbi:hypothetical protein [Bacteroides acidifaciens]|uniref:hypothetical protein n=1 Tax=Bacteroides acidifaciens TaxID=85831 RepID=UPI002557E86B|nr:hypothetical protein [Bacteroides acidifaciens]